MIPARLTSQRLVGEKLGAPRDVAAWMGALQAQDFGMALWKKTNTKAKPVAFEFFKKPSAATLHKAEKAADGYREFLSRNG